ncbi:helix-turn-helix domain-containing protein [Chitinophaga sp. 22620]|uniref:helix-turn-helix domain-containing protein n=1 Tax=Chitinophaga sp. 22620 TaxID=3453952 RepID=UPI003F83EC18
MSFAERMQEKRQEKELSQQDLATLVETSKNMISRYETGKMVPSIEMGAKIATALGTTLDYLVLGFVPQITPNEAKTILVEVESLPEEDLKHIMAVIDAFKTKAKVRRLLKD